MASVILELAALFLQYSTHATGRKVALYSYEHDIVNWPDSIIYYNLLHGLDEPNKQVGKATSHSRVWVSQSLAPKKAILLYMHIYQ